MQNFKYFNYPMQSNVLWTYNPKDTAITMLARRDLATWNVAVLLLDNFDTWVNHKPLSGCTNKVKDNHAKFGFLLSSIYVSLGVSVENVSLRDMALTKPPRELCNWLFEHGEIHPDMRIFQAEGFLPDFDSQDDLLKSLLRAQMPTVIKSLQAHAEKQVKSLKPEVVDLPD